MSFTSTFPTNLAKFSYVAPAPVQLGATDSSAGRESISVRIFILSDSATSIEIAKLERVVRDQGTGVEQVVSLVAKVSAKDSGYGREVAQKTYAEMLVIDQTKGIDRIAYKYMERVDTAGGAEVARIYLVVVDKAKTVELVVQKIFTSFDKSVAIDKTAQKEMRNIADYSRGFEVSLIALRRIDIASTSEIIIFIRTFTDVASALEKRLSPIPVKTFDTATTIDITIRAVKRRTDSATGFEISKISVAVFDRGIATDIIAVLSRFSRDSSAGIEKRLSPVPITRADFSSGYELSLFGYREWIRIDSAKGAEKIIRKDMSIIADGAKGTDISKINKFVKDRGIAIDVLISIDRLSRDRATGSEKRLSPISLRRADRGAGYERAWFYWWEGKRSDSAVARERLAEKQLTQLDISSVVEKAVVGVVTKDIVSAIDRYTCKCMQIHDIAVGFEKRLSPIPIRAIDVALPLEVIIHRYVEKLDSGAGIEVPILEAHLTPMPQPLYTRISLATHIGYNYVTMDQAVVAPIARRIMNLIVFGFTPEHNLESTISPSLKSSTYTGYILIGELKTGELLSAISVEVPDVLARQSIDIDTELPTMHEGFRNATENEVFELAMGLGRWRSTGFEYSFISDINLLLTTSEESSTYAGTAFIYDIETDNHLSINASTSFREVAVQSINIDELISPMESESRYATTVHEIKSSIDSKTIASTTFEAYLTALLGSLTSLSAEESWIENMVLINDIKPYESLSIMEAEEYKEEVVQSLNLDKLMNINETPYIETSVMNNITLGYRGQEKPSSFVSNVVADTVMHMLSHNIRNTCMAPVQLYEDGKLVVSSEAYASRDRTLKTVEVGDNVFVSTPPLIRSRGNQFLSGVTEESILLDLRRISEIMPSFASKIIEQGMILGRVQEARKQQIQPISVGESILSGLYKNVLDHVGRVLQIEQPIIEGAGTVKRFTSGSYTFEERIVYALTTLFKFVTISYLYLFKLQELEKGFRYVKEGDEVLHTDHNIFVDAFQLFIEFAQKLTIDRFRDDVDVNNALEALKSAVSKLRKLKSLDIFTPDDHNQVVECIERARRFLEIVRKNVGLET